MCKNYLTLRSQIYFGSSIHVYHGLQMMVSLYQDLFTNIEQMRQPQVSAMDIIFRTNFLSLGVLIFLGVEQRSKHLIKWPTILFILLLAVRFTVEILKEVKARDTDFLHKMSPMSMSMDTNPIVSAAVGVYIFLLFVYNHSLEFSEESSGANASHCSSSPPSSNPFRHYFTSAGSRCSDETNSPGNHGPNGNNRGGSNNGRSDQFRNNEDDDRAQLLPQAARTMNNSSDHLHRSLSSFSANIIPRRRESRDDQRGQHNIRGGGTGGEDCSLLQPEDDKSCCNADDPNFSDPSEVIDCTSNLLTPSGDALNSTTTSTTLQLQTIDVDVSFNKTNGRWTCTPFEFFHKKAKPSSGLLSQHHRVDAV